MAEPDYGYRAVIREIDRRRELGAVDGKSPAEHLLNQFMWERTDEGHQFWQDVHEGLQLHE